MPYVLELTVT